MQGQIVLLYQLLEALIQDVKPGGLLNAEPRDGRVYVEALTLSERAKSSANRFCWKLNGCILTRPNWGGANSMLTDRSTRTLFCGKGLHDALEIVHRAAPCRNAPGHLYVGRHPSIGVHA